LARDFRQKGLEQGKASLLLWGIGHGKDGVWGMQSPNDYMWICAMALAGRDAIGSARRGHAVAKKAPCHAIGEAQ
jgi:hypothetical protein